ncbi:MAG: hypothetical protein U1E23_08870 [Reyranellaceae bacterium]
MTRSSRGHRPATSWAVPPENRRAPRVVRLERPANDNRRRTVRPAHVVFMIAGTVLALLALAAWLYP